MGKGRRYPCLWVDCFPSGECLGWDKIELEEEKELRKARREAAPPPRLHSYCRAWIEHMGDPFHVPIH